MAFATVEWLLKMWWATLKLPFTAAPFLDGNGSRPTTVAGDVNSGKIG